MLCIEKFNKKLHDRNRFISSNEELNVYLQKYANQDQKANRNQTFAVVKDDCDLPKRIYGYFSINAFSIFSYEAINLTTEPYGYLPAILIGRLAIDKNQDFLSGHELLWMALNLCLKISYGLGVSIVAVDPIDDRAKKFYLKQGFIQISKSNSTLYIPMKLISAVLVRIEDKAIL